MRTRADYRKLAEDCVRLAGTASTAEQRAVLLHIAHIWLKLADRASSDQAIGFEDGSMRVSGEQAA